MTHFISTRGEVAPVDFETAVLQGFAADGGLYVPETIPRISEEQLQKWSRLSYVDLAFEILSLFIERTIIPADELRKLLAGSFDRFENPDILPVVRLKTKPNTYILELFQGPTLSFKDVAMGFLVNTIDFFLERKNDWMSLVVATTGDTGPAAAHASAGKKSIECWVLYPDGMISEEQARQMTTLDAPNVHAVGVSDCPDGGDDLDLVLARMFADDHLRKKLKLSSVNSINWCRVMVQAVHYFYSYFRVVDQVGEKIVFSVPSGAFGNLFGGYLARAIGLPVKAYICANNQNAALHRVLSTGRFTKRDLIPTLSSAIDIVVPYNFWRYLYFASGQDYSKIRQWMDDFQKKGAVQLDSRTADAIREGYISASITDEQTLSTIADTYQSRDGYLLDPHGAVAIAAADMLSNTFASDTKIVCLATAHAAKFPDVVRKALSVGGELPEQAIHRSIEDAKERCQHMRLCDYSKLAPSLKNAMQSVAENRVDSGVFD
ncbi:MAG: threonine synthase [Thermodesulfobacteriota bacterium]